MKSSEGKYFSNSARFQFISFWTRFSTLRRWRHFWNWIFSPLTRKTSFNTHLDIIFALLIGEEHQGWNKFKIIEINIQVTTPSLAPIFLIDRFRYRTHWTVPSSAVIARRRCMLWEINFSNKLVLRGKWMGMKNQCRRQSPGAQLVLARKI